MIKELLDGLTSRLKGVGEKGGEVPPAGGIPPAPGEDEMPPAGGEQAPDVKPQEGEEDFSALLGGGDTSELENKVKELEDRTVKLESSVKDTLDIAKQNQERLDSIDGNMKKFISLYELVTNQINPFVDQSQPFKEPEKPPLEEAEEKIVMPPAEELEKEEPDEKEEEVKPEPKKEKPKPAPAPNVPEGDEEQVMFLQSVKDGNASFVLEWITSLVNEEGDVEENTKLLTYLLNMGWITPKAYEALMQHVRAIAQAGRVAQPQRQRIPLMAGMPSQIPQTGQPPGLGRGAPVSADDKGSLMEVLEWVKYLVDKVGSDEAEEILKYLVQLGWITPDAHRALLKYIDRTLPEEALQQFREPEETKVQLPPDRIPSPDEFMQREAQYRMPVQPVQQPVRMPFQQPVRKSPENEIIPLTEIGSDIDSLAIVLEWIRYLVDRAGTQGAKDIFNYYLNIGWVSQQVYQQLVKYVDGIKAKEEETVGYQPTVEDHATSLFFISRLKHMDLSEEDIQNMLGK